MRITIEGKIINLDEILEEIEEIEMRLTELEEMLANMQISFTKTDEYKEESQ